MLITSKHNLIRPYIFPQLSQIDHDTYNFLILYNHERSKWQDTKRYLRKGPILSIWQSVMYKINNINLQAVRCAMYLATEAQLQTRRELKA